MDRLDLIPANIELLQWVDVEAVRNNLDQFPGDFQEFREEILDKVDGRFETPFITLEHISHFVFFEIDGQDKHLLTGDLPFSEMREYWETETYLEQATDRGVEVWGSGYIAVFEDKQAIVGLYGKPIDYIVNGSGSLADAESHIINLIINELGNSPAVSIDIGYNDCVKDLPGCMGLGASFVQFDRERGWIHFKWVAAFDDEQSARQALDSQYVATESIHYDLDDLAAKLSYDIGVRDYQLTVDPDMEVDGRFLSGEGIISLGEEMTPAEATAVPPTAAPEPTPFSILRSIPTAAPTEAPSAPTPTPFSILRPIPTAAPATTAAAPTIAAFFPTATRAPFATAAPIPQGTMSSRARWVPYANANSNGPGAIYVGDQSQLVGPPVWDMIDEIGDVTFDAIGQHLWIYESDYYHSLLEKARLNNPTRLTSSGERITLQHVCLNRALYWCQLVEAYFAPNVERRTNGQVRIDVSSFGNLGLYGPDTPYLLGNGTLEMVELEDGYISDEFPTFEIHSLYGLWPDNQTRFEAQTRMMPELYGIIANDMGAQPLFNNWIAGIDQFLFCHSPIQRLRDFEGLKTRSHGSALSDWLNGMGAAAQFLAFAEVYTALERGILDCGVTGADPAYGQRWYEVVDYMNGPIPSFDSTINAVNWDVWYRIPADIQQILIEEGAKHELEALRLASIRNVEALEQNFWAGQTFEPFSSEIRARSRQVAIDRVIPGWLDRAGYGDRVDRAKSIFNLYVRPLVNVEIERDGTVIDLR